MSTAPLVIEHQTVLGLPPVEFVHLTAGALAAVRQVARSDPAHVAEEALSHLADGPTWIYGSADPRGGSPTAALSRREAVLLMSRTSKVQRNVTLPS